MKLQITQMIDPTRMSLTEVSSRINKKDNRSIKNWLSKNNIKLIKDGNDYFVYKWLFEFSEQLKIVEQLKEIYPNSWHKLYEAASTNEKMKNAIFLKHPPTNLVMKNQQNNNKIITK